MLGRRAESLRPPHTFKVWSEYGARPVLGAAHYSALAEEHRPTANSEIYERVAGLSTDAWRVCRNPVTTKAFYPLAEREVPRA